MLLPCSVVGNIKNIWNIFVQFKLKILPHTTIPFTLPFLPLQYFCFFFLLLPAPNSVFQSPIVNTKETKANVYFNHMLTSNKQKNFLVHRFSRSWRGEATGGRQNRKLQWLHCVYAPLRFTIQPPNLEVGQSLPWILY